MTSYTYRAVHRQGHIHKGTMSAANENELAFFLSELNLELIEAKPERNRTSYNLLPMARRAVPLQDRVIFCSQMGDLLTSGIPFTQALELINNTMQDSSFHDKLVIIGNLVKSGTLISRAFAEHADVFDPVFLSILTAGESSGDLAATFQRLTRHLQWEMSMKRDVSRAIRYPLFLLVIACGVTSFMMLFVVPQIINFLTNMGRELPLSTRLLINIAEAFSTLWWSAPPVLLALYLTLRILRKIDLRIATATDALILKLPLLGRVIGKLAMARLTTSLTILLKSSLTLPQSLALATATLDNKSFEQKAGEAHQRLLDGLPLSKAAHMLFTSFMIQKLMIGEQSGTLPKTLDEIAQSCDREAHEAVENFLGLLEPILTIMVGGLLAWIVLAVLGPVYGSLAPLSQGA